MVGWQYQSQQAAQVSPVPEHVLLFARNFSRPLGRQLMRPGLALSQRSPRVLPRAPHSVGRVPTS